MKLQIPRLQSGGLITNYFCTSRCRHCAYYSSPAWEKEYISRETTRELIEIIKALGCDSLHIGGGEPLLRPPALFDILEVFHNRSMGIEYIETNSSWVRGTEQHKTEQHNNDQQENELLLRTLMRYGVSTLLISISPFHNEFIPLQKIETAIHACRSVGMGVFPWVIDFLTDLRRFDPETTHSLEEYETVFGKDYTKTIPNRYWISLRGRALETYKKYMPKLPYKTILNQNGGNCRELFDVSHFHLDLYANYIPGLCTGLSIAAEDLLSPLSAAAYPFLTTLMEKGITGLAETAEESFGFVPGPEYVSKCDLCYDIRSYLVTCKNIASKDLQPRGFYIHD